MTNEFLMPNDSFKAKNSLKSDLFSYHLNQKKVKGLFVIFGSVMLICLILTFLLFFNDINPFKDTFIEGIFLHISTQISQQSYLGMFYVTLFGGLFIFSIPIELIFLIAIPHNNPILLAIVALGGLAPSYYLNYVIGRRFSGIARKIVSIKQFYKVKSLINRRGQVALFFFNSTPFGSQIATFICGVFNYNPHRLLLITAFGQLVKYTVMVMLFGFIW